MNNHMNFGNTIQEYAPLHVVLNSVKIAQNVKENYGKYDLVVELNDPAIKNVIQQKEIIYRNFCPTMRGKSAMVFRLGKPPMIKLRFRSEKVTIMLDENGKKINSPKNFYKDEDVRLSIVGKPWKYHGSCGVTWFIYEIQKTKSKE